MMADQSSYEQRRTIRWTCVANDHAYGGHAATSLARHSRRVARGSATAMLRTSSPYGGTVNGRLGWRRRPGSRWHVRRKRLHFQLVLDQSLNGPQVLPFFVITIRYGDPFRSHSACAPDPMHVGLRLDRHVVVEDV